MTLHWWMHWFWVTLLITLACSSPSLSAPQSEELQHITETATRHTERQGRAMYFSKPVSTTIKPLIINITDPDDKLLLPKSLFPEDPKSDTEPPKVLNINDPPKVAVISNTSQDMNPDNSNVKLLEGITEPNKNDTSNNDTDIVHPAIQWTSLNSSTQSTTTKTPEAPAVTEEAVPQKNVTESNTTVGSKKRNSTRPDLVKDDVGVEGLSESRIVTEKPLSLETSYLQTRAQQPSEPNIESYRRVVDPGLSGMDTGAIAGISFAALVLAALAGSTAFVLYRRRYLNKPLTLNDKCSNPDSSGYLDDSTIRDNSEEMYSLDNDSFLNSLEAMTIQNYWTDTVKHTKL